MKSSIAVDHEASAQSFADNSGGCRWLSVKEFSAAASVAPRTARDILANCLIEGRSVWRNAQLQVRVARGRSGSRYEVALDSLPKDVRGAHLLAEAQAAIDGEAAQPGPIPSVVAGAQSSLADISSQQAEYESRGAWFGRQSPGIREEAAKRVDVLLQLDQMHRQTGLSVSRCAEKLSKSLPDQPAKNTILRWKRLVGDHPHHAWAYFVAPTWGHRNNRTTCDERALAFIKSDYLRRERPTFSSCYRRLCSAAKAHQWSIPSEDTLRRLIEQTVKPEVIALGRRGADALKKKIPPQERDRSVFGALEAVNTDGFDFKVWAVMEDGEVTQPCMVHWQDLYSGKLLSQRIGPTENTELYLSSFGDLLHRFGIPQQVHLDNTRAAANKAMTGGVPNRYRFKVKKGESKGVLPLLGVAVHWTKPGHAQSKPIERPHRDFRNDIEKHPALAGAFSKAGAVPIAKLREVVADCIDEQNSRPGRISRVCAGRSFNETFDESYARRAESIQRPTEDQLRLFLMSTKEVKASSENGSFHLFKNRYWAEFLPRFAGQTLQVRFDPDNLHEGAHVYTGDNRYVGFAKCIERRGFVDTSAAKATARDHARLNKITKEELKISRRLNARELAALLPPSQAALSAPIAKVQRALFGKSRPEHLGNDSSPIAVTVSSPFDAVMETYSPQPTFNPKRAMP